MIVQVYKNTKDNTIILLNKSLLKYDKDKIEECKLIEEFEGEDWTECNKQINKKYFNSAASE